MNIGWGDITSIIPLHITEWGQLAHPIISVVTAIRHTTGWCVSHIFFLVTFNIESDPPITTMEEMPASTKPRPIIIPPITPLIQRTSSLIWWIPPPFTQAQRLRRWYHLGGHWRHNLCRTSYDKDSVVPSALHLHHRPVTPLQRHAVWTFQKLNFPFSFKRWMTFALTNMFISCSLSTSDLSTSSLSTSDSSFCREPRIYSY